MKQKRIMLASVLALTALHGFSQSAIQTDWKLEKTEKNVSVFTQVGECRNSQVVFFKIQNTGEKPVEIQLNSFDNTTGKKINLNAGDSFSGDCSNRLPMAVLKDVIPQGKTINDLHLKLDIQILNK